MAEAKKMGKLPKDKKSSSNPETERREILDKLAKEITSKLCERAAARAPKELEWERAQRLYDSPLRGSSLDTMDHPFIKNRGDTRRPEPNIVRTKCDVAISNCVSIQFAAGEKNWDIFPPANTSDPQVTQAAREMSKEIEAQLQQTRYAAHGRQAISDRVILGTGILKGPVNTGKRRVEYYKGADGVWVPRVGVDYKPKIYAVSPWRFYPDHTVTDFEECSDAIEIHPMSPIDLSQYMQHPGFDGKAILEILSGDGESDPIKPDAYNDGLLNIKAESWARNPYLYKNKYVVIEYHGPVTYDDLNKLGLCPTYESPTREYYGEIWVCAGRVIRMELENLEGYYESPYSVSIWKKDQSSIFGFGHPLLLSDTQQVITQAYHMILDNAALTSGPQIAMYKRYIEPIDGDWNIRPNKIWYLTDPNAKIDEAIKFFNPTNVIGNIMPVMDLARQFADEESATPALAAGLGSPQVGDSATGQLIMQQNSTTLLDFLAEEWSDQITEKVIRRMYAWNMQYNPNEAIKGDYVVDVKSASEYKNKLMITRDLERLSMEVMNNPEMADVVDMEELTRARLAVMQLPSNKIVRKPEESAQIRQQRQEQPNPAMIELQIKMAEAETKRYELQLKEKQLQFEMQQQQQRELWEHEEKMGSNQARELEAQAQVMKARSEVQVEMIQLAQKDEQFRAKLAADREMAELGNSAQIFLESMRASNKRIELAQTEEELAIKREKGTGI